MEQAIVNQGIIDSTELSEGDTTEREEEETGNKTATRRSVLDHGCVKTDVTRPSTTCLFKEARWNWGVLSHLNAAGLLQGPATVAVLKTFANGLLHRLLNLTHSAKTLHPEENAFLKA